jgi:hypothetical protein
MNKKPSPNAVTIQDFASADAAVATWVDPSQPVGNVIVDVREPGSSDPTRPDFAVLNIPGHGLTAYCRPDQPSVAYYIHVDEAITRPLTHLFFRLKDLTWSKVQISLLTSAFNEEVGTPIEATSDGTYSSKIDEGKVPAIIRVRVFSMKGFEPGHGILAEVFGD